MTELNWVAWDGGPVLPDIAPDRTFWVKRRSGALGSYYRRSDAYWGHVGGPGDIVAYALVVEPEALQVTGNEAVNMSRSMEEHLAFNRRVNEA